MTNTFTLINPCGQEVKTIPKIFALKWIKKHLDHLIAKRDDGYVIRCDATGEIFDPVEFAEKVLAKKSMLVEKLTEELELLKQGEEAGDYDSWGHWGHGWGHGHDWGHGWGHGWGNGHGWGHGWGHGHGWH